MYGVVCWLGMMLELPEIVPKFSIDQLALDLRKWSSTLPLLEPGIDIDFEFGPVNYFFILNKYKFKTILIKPQERV